MKRMQRGFTLVEITVATFVFLIVGLASIGSYMMVLQAKHKAEGRMAVYDSAIVIKQHLVKQVQSAGGDSVRPFASIWVEDNCAARNGMPACNGSDRLNVFKTTSVNGCQVLASLPGNRLQMQSVPSCCVNAAAWDNKNVVLVSGSMFLHQRITNVNNGLCQVRVVNSSFSSLPSSPTAGFPAFGYKNAPADVTGSALTDFFPASPSLNLILVNAETYFLETSTNELKLYAGDNNGNNAFTPTATDFQTLAGHIFDLQFALGYDVTPSNMIVTDLGTNGDEWLFNAPTDVWRAGGLTNVSIPNLWMMQVGLTLGHKIPVQDAANSVQLLNGPARTSPGWRMVSSRTKATPRNNEVFF